MTPETLATALLVAAMPASGFGVLVLITAPDRDRAVLGAVGLFLVAWVVLGLYMAIVFAS